MSKHHRKRFDRTVQALLTLELNPEHASIVSEMNPSANAPYHNSGHCFTVALNALAGARYHKIDYQPKRLLFLAGLYHDYDHSAGEATDDVNIAKAVSGMRQWVGELESLSVEDIEAVASIIEATIYPGHLFAYERNLLQSIICDADHMQYLEPDADDFTAGLSIEMKQPVTRESTRIFLEGYDPRTEWGRKRIPLSLMS